MRMPEDRVSKLLKRLEAEWAALNESYAGVPESVLLEPGVAGDWSVKDVIAHVTTWEEEALKHLPVILAGGRPPRYATAYGGLDAFNAQTAERKRGLSLTKVLHQRDDTHRRLIAFIQSAPADAFASDTRARRRLRLDTYSHYPLHTRMIREWRELRAL
jgi:hypothetical protein